MSTVGHADLDAIILRGDFFRKLRCNHLPFDVRKVNLKEVPEQKKKSPKGKFGRTSKNISVALGREPESLDLSKRHPFDLALVRITNGTCLCPYHAHAAESELYRVVSG